MRNSTIIILEFQQSVTRSPNEEENIFGNAQSRKSVFVQRSFMTKDNVQVKRFSNGGNFHWKFSRNWTSLSPSPNILIVFSHNQFQTNFRYPTIYNFDNLTVIEESSQKAMKVLGDPWV